MDEPTQPDQGLGQEQIYTAGNLGITQGEALEFAKVSSWVFLALSWTALVSAVFSIWRGSASPFKLPHGGRRAGAGKVLTSFLLFMKQVQFMLLVGSAIPLGYVMDALVSKNRWAMLYLEVPDIVTTNRTETSGVRFLWGSEILFWTLATLVVFIFGTLITGACALSCKLYRAVKFVSGLFGFFFVVALGSGHVGLIDGALSSVLVWSAQVGSGDQSVLTHIISIVLACGWLCFISFRICFKAPASDFGMKEWQLPVLFSMADDDDDEEDEEDCAVDEGALTAEEEDKIIVKYKGVIAGFFTDFDQDNSGTLNEKEIKDILCGTDNADGANEGVPVDKVATMFQKFDKDHDGSINAEELTQMFVAMEKEKQERKKRRRLEKQKRRAERACQAAEADASASLLPGSHATGAAAVQGQGKGTGGGVVQDTKLIGKEKAQKHEMADAAQQGKLAWRVEPIRSVLYGGYYESCYPRAKAYSLFMAFKPSMWAVFFNLSAAGVSQSRILVAVEIAVVEFIDLSMVLFGRPFLSTKDSSIHVACSFANMAVALMIVSGAVFKEVVMWTADLAPLLCLISILLAGMSMVMRSVGNMKAILLEATAGVKEGGEGDALDFNQGLARKEGGTPRSKNDMNLVSLANPVK